MFYIHYKQHDVVQHSNIIILKYLKLNKLDECVQVWQKNYEFVVGRKNVVVYLPSLTYLCIWMWDTILELRPEGGELELVSSLTRVVGGWSLTAPCISSIVPLHLPC